MGEEERDDGGQFGEEYFEPVWDTTSTTDGNH